MLINLASLFFHFLITSLLVTDSENLSAIESNFIQTEIGKSAYEYQKKVDNKDRTIVGVNKFMTEDSVEPEILNIDSDKIENQKSYNL